MTLPLQAIAAAMGASGAAPEAMIAGWSTDSRSISRGDLFFALRGPRHDGHEHVAAALAQGAAAAVVERELPPGGALLRVGDTYAALAAAASWARGQWGGKVIAVTGSAGKTTAKDAIAHVLSARMEVGKTAGNLNNHVGLPLSILRLPDNARAAVLELGMNHAGEIRALARVARPDIGVVTNVGFAHVEFFDSIDGVALAKRELIEELPAGATAILNADDTRVARFADVHSGPTLTFGLSAAAEVRAVDVQPSESGTSFTVRGNRRFHTRLEGSHGVRNVLAALAVARVLGLPLAELAEAVSSFEAPSMRGRRLEHDGIRIIDDCYNSNPEAAKAMLEVLGGTPGRRRIAVLGEMLELGRWAGDLHRGVGRFAAESGVDVVVGIRGAARQVVEAAVEAGLPAGAAYFFDDPGEAGDHLRKLAREGDVILFKGSRGTRVEEALRRFLE